jgi:hypothetical protein
MPYLSSTDKIPYVNFFCKIFEKNVLFCFKFQPIENDRSSARKVPIETTHRRALDPSANNTPTRRLLGSMPHGRSNRGLEMATWASFL